MQSAYELANFSYFKDKDMRDLLSVRYKDLSKPVEQIEEGLVKKIGIQKIDNSVVVIGNLDDKKEASILDYNDIVTLNSSCAHRILHGQWLSFVGEKISLSQDGYLTDLFTEINLEERGQGAMHAWQYFFGTSIR